MKELSMRARMDAAKLLDDLFPDDGVHHVRDEKRNRIGRSVPLLRKRLRRAVAVLDWVFRKHFKGQFTVELDTRRMYSNCRSFYLQWENTPQTTEGSVSFHVADVDMLDCEPLGEEADYMDVDQHRRHVLQRT